MEIYLSLLIAVIGLIMFYISAKPETKEIGHVMFFVGLLAFLFGANAGHLIIPGR